MKRFLITIDGPSGAGKSTVSRRVAQRLDYTYVDTGGLYRAVALVALSERCAPDDDYKLARICRHLVLRFENSSEGPKLYATYVPAGMDGDDVTERIRTPEIGMFASAVSARSVVRAYLLVVQREMAKKGGVVFEGRDMGTVVFPEADIKFYLDADLDTRAMRRCKELAESHTAARVAEVREAMKKRDDDDSSRVLAPLMSAHDAIRIDSTCLEIGQVVETMLGYIRTHAK